MTTMEDRKKLIQKADAETLLGWFELYSEQYHPLTNPNKDTEETYKMIKAEIIRRLTK